MVFYLLTIYSQVESAPIPLPQAAGRYACMTMLLQVTIDYPLSFRATTLILAHIATLISTLTPTFTHFICGKFALFFRDILFFVCLKEGILNSL